MRQEVSGQIYNGEGIEIEHFHHREHGPVLVITIVEIDSGIEELVCRTPREAAAILHRIERPDLAKMIREQFPGDKF